MNKTLVLIIRWLIILAMPVLIVLLSARIMVNTWYPSFEYAKSNFPPDLFGFTQAQRLEFGTISINFLNAPEPPEVAVKMLEALRLPGTDQPLFTIYENQHMVDVKRLMDELWRVLAIAAGVVIIGSAILLIPRRTRGRGLRRDLRRRAVDHRPAHGADPARAALVELVLCRVPWCLL